MSDVSSMDRTLPARSAGSSRLMAKSLREAWRTLKADKFAMAGLLYLLALFCVATFAGSIAPHDPTFQTLGKRLTPGVWVPGGSTTFPLGTDHLGRDMLSRLIYGSRISIIVGLSTVAIAGTIGTLLGLVSGYYGGNLDDLIMRWADIQMAFPGLLLALSVLALFGPSLQNMVLVLALNNWMWYARLTRGVMLSMREVLFVEAARVIGASNARIIFKHCFPNLASPLITLGTLEVARMILSEASLSFLGFGVQPPTPAWGLMLAEGRGYLPIAWWPVTFAGICIGLTVLAINLVASWLRSVTDPHQRYKLLQQTG
jgi:ABC-type dipeptide/oligopeptide/nickel transport system permease subunit